MKKILVIFCLVLLAGVGLYAKELIKLVTPVDLYAQNSFGGSCIRVVNTGWCLSSPWRTGLTGVPQAVLVGKDGIAYNLYENSSCTVPVYFN